jgi:hypothetical protein
MSTINPAGRKINPTMNLLQLIFEIAIIVGYALGIVGGLFGLYYLAMFWVIPFAIANMIFALQQKNGTEAFTITNLIMSFVTLIPFIGFFSAVAGIVMSSLALVKVGQYTGQIQDQPQPSSNPNNQPETFTDVEEVTKAETKALEAESQTQKKSEPFTQQEPTEQKTEEPKKEEKISQESTEPTKKEDEVAEMKDETKADIVDEKKS